MRARPICPRLLAVGSWMLVGAACGEPIQLETDGAESGNVPTSSTTATLEPTDPDSSGGAMPTERQADILFVIDNSGSMGEEQGLIAANIGALVTALDAASPPVDYRIGVTTTDNGNPWCQGTGPEAGALRATSCRSRPVEFVFEGAQTVDATQEACYDVCSTDIIELGGLNWIEVDNSTGATNVVGGDVNEALRCVLPQGINGCGFESHLESTWKSLRRFETDNDPDFGFHRPGALMTIVIITDEADCSYNNEWETIFLPDGDRVFWSDPTAPAPTSAVCWNAGVACVGSGVYDDCVSVDLDASGNQVADDDADDDAVLRPTSRYTAAFSELSPYMMLIAGASSDGTVIYADSPDDPLFQGDFGIGPGCSSNSGRAVPPVRMREVVQQVNGGDPSLFSICSADYSAAFQALGSGIIGRLP